MLHENAGRSSAAAAVAVDDGKEQLRRKGFRMESSETEHLSWDIARS